MYSSVVDVSKDIRNFIDTHWRLELSETDLIEKIRSIFELPDNRGLILRGYHFSSTFKRQLGKKRVEFLIKILNEIDKELYGGLC